MNQNRAAPRKLLSLYQVGSFLVLLICLLGASIFLAQSYIKKERERSEIYAEQLKYFFEYQYRTISEEMWTQNYESISVHVADIAKQLGHATYRIILLDPSGNCVFSANTDGSTRNCETLQGLKDEMPRWNQSFNIEPLFRFDSLKRQHIYMVPLRIGSIHKGYLYVALSDPYGFYRGHTILAIWELFRVPILSILLLWFFWLVFSRIFILKPYLSQLVELERKESLGKVAAQLAHDIYSPLTSLMKVVKNSHKFPPEERELLKSAASRISHLANDILGKYRFVSQKPTKEFHFVSTLTKSILDEKQVFIKGRKKIQMELEIENSALLEGVTLSPTEFERILSNLLDNAIDASDGKRRNTIKVNVSNKTNQILVSIEDSGKGIDPKILGLLRSVGGSFGKAKGSGMGLTHARETLKRVGGKVKIESELNRGTTVKLCLPIAPTPIWLVKEITLGRDEKIVVMDDDPSIHLLWAQRLKGYDCAFLSTPEKFDISKFSLEKSRFLFDYEFHGSSMTGLDVFEKHGLERRTILVTSHFNNVELQRTVEELGLKILPKLMISDVLIHELNAPLSNVRKYLAILIDDDSSVHAGWHYDAHRLSREVLTCFDEGEFFRYGVDESTPICIDKHLPNKISGIDVAKRLWEKGYQYLYIATSDPPESIPSCPFIKGVVGKDLPEEFLMEATISSKNFLPRLRRGD